MTEPGKGVLRGHQGGAVGEKYWMAVPIAVHRPHREQTMRSHIRSVTDEADQALQLCSTGDRGDHAVRDLCSRPPRKLMSISMCEQSRARRL